MMFVSDIQSKAYSILELEKINHKLQFNNFK